MTRAEIRTLVKTLVSEGGTNYFTDAAYNRFIDDAYTTVHNLAPWDWQTSTVSATTTTTQYAFTGFTKIQRVDYDDRPLEFRTREWLANLDYSFDTTSGRPQYWYMGAELEHGYQADDTEVQTIGVYPKADALDDIRVMGIASPDALAADGTSPNLPFWAHRAIAYECAAQVLESQGELRNEPLADAYRMLSRFWIDNLLRIMADRHSAQKNHVIGRSLHAPKRLRRETSIPGTGLTGMSC